MKTLSVISYIISSILLVVSCFMSSTEAIWWIGGFAIFFLIAGAVLQYYVGKRQYMNNHNHSF